MYTYERRIFTHNREIVHKGMNVVYKPGKCITWKVMRLITLVQDFTHPKLFKRFLKHSLVRTYQYSPALCFLGCAQSALQVCGKRN